MIFAQDRHEIFVSVATCEQTYIDYLQNKGGPDSFLKITEYGPYKIDDSHHMEDLAVVVMTYCLEVTEEIQRTMTRSRCQPQM